VEIKKIILQIIAKLKMAKSNLYSHTSRVVSVTQYID